jgi:hypothetical protein
VNSTSGAHSWMYVSGHCHVKKSIWKDPNCMHAAYESTFALKFSIHVLVHSSLNPTHHTRATRSHATPHHHSPTSKLDSLLHHSSTSTPSITKPTSTAAIRAKSIDFCFIREYYTIPIIISPMAMTSSKF